MVVCQDPTGAFFAAWEAGQSAGMQRFGEMGAVCWVEVYSRDGERARDFYAKLLGLEWQKLEGLPYWPLKRGEEIVCGTMQMPCHYPADLPSHWNVYFAVEDVDASVAKLVSLGGTQISPPFDSPFGRLAFVTDTAGVRFNLMTPAQGG
jgi:predicted enzyme related to lactoylglutathione lyase